MPAHQGVEGNERAGGFAKSAAEGGGGDSTIPDEYLWETSLARAAEAKGRTTAQWITAHFSPGRKYRPSSGRGVKRKQLRRAQKPVASCYYQLVSGHAAIGPYLKDRIRKTDGDSCWWCVEERGRLPLHRVLGVASIDQATLERRGECLWVEAPKAHWSGMSGRTGPRRRCWLSLRILGWGI